MVRSNDILELIETAPMAFTLAAVIALRARFQPGVSLKGLRPGEAFLGDHERCGLTQQQYRTAKAQLARWGFASFRATNRGTIATLMDSRLFEVLNFEVNDQNNKLETSSQQLTKKEEKGIEPPPAEVVAFFEEVAAFWNSKSQLTNRVRTLGTGERAELFRARASDPFFREHWRAGINTAATTPFCIGKGANGWVATFEWFIQPDTLMKLVDGFYQRQKPKLPEYRVGSGTL